MRVMRSAIVSALMAAFVVAMAVEPATAQSSSLFVVEPAQQQYERAEVRAEAAPAQAAGGGARLDDAPQRLSPAIAAASFSAVRVPEPRAFSRHDLVTIIIRESSETDWRARLGTEKDVDFQGEITDIPRFQLRDLLNLQLRPSRMDEGNPAVGVGFNNEFDGDGTYSRRESLTGRITGEIVDIKPNGMLVLEARKQIVTDDEALELVITGMARPEDVSIDNTILSTEMHNLNIDKQHDGELRRSTRKGWITRALEMVFNF